ncbi:MAG: sulfatase-like hydrolase/transferase, partial [Verrucomicrobiota bacterium]
PDTMMDTAVWKPIKEGNWECRPGPMVSSWDPYENIPTTTERAVAYIKESAKREEPFFLYFAFPSPHAPIIPNDEFDGTSEAGPYGDFVVETDDACGQLLRAITEAGVAEETLVIFSADNGPEKYAYARDREYDHWSAEPFRGLKRDLYEGGHHVPFLMKWPGVTTPGAVTDALISQVDIMATLATALGYELPSDAAEDSHDLTPLFTDASAKIRDYAVQNTKAGEYAIRQDGWILIDAKSGYHSRVDPEWEAKREVPGDDKGDVELYHFAEDPGQRKNVADQYPERVAALKALLHQVQEQGYSAPRLR